MMGDGVPRNDALAAQWARRAANQGVMTAQLGMARVHMNEAVRTQSMELAAKAYVWASLAAAAGDADAKSLLDKLDRDMPREMLLRSQAEATKWRRCTQRECLDWEPRP
ncbi:MAG: hypothetical protein EOP84_25185 [Verrucomicrobiaceae bacterium]|nr:MAG: hypothetical protein EOP84_25185 [Verrucomicrobiaceae bacterium]